MGLNFPVQITRFSNGRRQTKKLVEKVLRSLDGVVPGTTLANSETLRAFITARFGPLETFYIFAWPFQKFTAAAIGTGNGSATQFVMPYKATTVTALYAGGVSKAFTVTVGAGSGGEDRANFSSYTPTNGEAVTADLIGRERIPVELTGTTVPIGHPLRIPQSNAKAADFYTVSVLEVP